LLLVFIAAVVAATAFAFSETSVRAANQSYVPARKHDVDANSAIQAAIQYVRNDPAAGQDPNGNPTCLQSPDPQHSFTYTSNVIVNICPRQGSFVLASGPAAALLSLKPTTATTTGAGVGIDFNGTNNITNINGNLWSNSEFDVTGALHLTGDLYSWNSDNRPATWTGQSTYGCRMSQQGDSLTVTGNKHCNERADAASTTTTGSATTTLSSTINSSTTTVQVQSAAGFPATGQFFIRVEQEAMLVTAGAGTTTWTVTRAAAGTTAAQHAGGTTVSLAFGRTTTTLPVQSAASFPATGQFMVRIEDEKMLVTGGAGTTTWTVARSQDGTTAAAHPYGATVSYIDPLGVDPGDPYIHPNDPQGCSKIDLANSCGYQPAGSVGAVQHAASVTPNAGNCTLQPGTYTHGNELSAMASAPQRCSQITLAPGVFYLDFPDDSTDMQLPYGPFASGSDNTWTLNAPVVGPGTFTYDASGNITGVDCTAAGGGAQIVFANGSQMVNQKYLSLPCAMRAPNVSGAPRIALFGLADGAGAKTTLSPTSAVDCVACTAHFANPGNAAYLGSGDTTYPIGGTLATASSVPKNTTVSLQLTYPTNSLPSSPVTGIVVHAAHAESGGIGFATSPPTLKWGNCSVPLTGNAPYINPNPSLSQQNNESTWTSSDLLENNWVLNPACAFNAQSDPLTLTWSASTGGNNNQTVSLDGATIDVYTGVQSQKTSGLNGGPTSIYQGRTKDIIDSSGGGAVGHDSFAFNDAIYAPYDSIAPVCNNANGCQGFVAGNMAAWSLTFNVYTPEGQAASGGGSSPGALAPGQVVYDVYVRDSSTSPWKKWTSAYVTYDPNTLKPTIQTWVNRR
jgi:hypothetical protein